MSEKQPIISGLLTKATSFLRGKQEIIGDRVFYREEKRIDPLKMALYSKLVDGLSRIIVISNPSDPFYGLDVQEPDEALKNYKSVDQETAPLNCLDDLIGIDMVGFRNQLIEAKKKRDIGGAKTIVEEIVKMRSIIENRTTIQDYIARRIIRSNSNITANLDTVSTRFAPESRESKFVSFVKKEQTVLNSNPGGLESMPGMEVNTALSLARLERAANGLFNGKIDIAEEYLGEQRQSAEQRREEELDHTKYIERYEDMMRLYVAMNGGNGRSLEVTIGDHSGNVLYFSRDHVFTCVAAFNGDEKAMEELSKLCDESTERHERWNREDPYHPQTYFIGLVDDVYHDIFDRAKVRQKYLARIKELNDVSSQKK